MKPARNWVFGILLGAAAGGGLWAYNAAHGGHEKPEKKAKPEQTEVTVSVEAAAVRPVRRAVEVVGSLEGFEEVSISPKVEGRVGKINHDVGDVVAPGTCLAEIDDTDYKLGVMEATRGLEMELARLGLKAMPADGKFDLLRVPAVMRARNLEENAASAVERSRRLGRAMSVEEQERYQTDYRVAGATREHAELEAQAGLASARFKVAQLETARQKLADACIAVPTPSARRLPPGVTDAKSVRFVVASRKVAEGEVVRVFPSPVLFRLVMDSPLKLVVTIPERFFRDVAVGQAVELASESYAGDAFEGKVFRVNPTIDRANRTFTAEVLIPNADRRLRPGGFVKAKIVTRVADKTLTVPEEAIVRFAGVVKVFAVRDGKARPVEVTALDAVNVTDKLRTRRWIEVRGDLRDGEQVVVQGQSQLAQGTPVKIR